MTRCGEPGFADAYGEAWSSGDGERLAAFFEPDCVYTDAGTSTRVEGHEGVRAYMRHMLAFAPDSVVRFRGLVADDERFSAEWTWSGTASGPMRLDGALLEPSGREFSVDGVAVCTLGTNGLVALHTDVYDMRATLKACGMSAQARAAETRTLVEALYEALRAGDAQAVEGVLDDDFTSRLVDGMPAGGGVHQGPRAAREEGWWAIGRRFAVVPEPEEWIACADGRLLVRGHYRGHAREGDERVDAAFTHLFAGRDGRLTGVDQVTDTVSWALPSEPAA